MVLGHLFLCLVVEVHYELALPNNADNIAKDVGLSHMWLLLGIWVYCCEPFWSEREQLTKSSRHSTSKQDPPSFGSPVTNWHHGCLFF
jgi:hypothetical protein